MKDGSKRRERLKVVGVRGWAQRVKERNVWKLIVEEDKGERNNKKQKKL